MLGFALSISIFYTLLLALSISAIVFWVGGKISPKSTLSEEKLLPYTGGEKVEHELVPVNIKLFDYALLFIVFDVISLMLFFSIGPNLGSFYTISKLSVILYVIIVMLGLIYFARRF